MASPMASLDPCVERTFRGHKGTVRGVSFSPNMKQVATASDDHIVTVWNFKPDLRAFRFTGHTVIDLSGPGTRRSASWFCSRQ